MKISVIILTYNGGEVLKKAITSLKEQKLRAEIEIIAVDSKSTDGTIEYLQKAGVRIISIDKNKFKYGPAREIGFSLASGDIIVTQSQDVLPISNRYLSLLVEPLIYNRFDVVQGKTIVPNNAEKKYFIWHAYPEIFYFTSEGSEFHQKSRGIGLSCECLAMTKYAWKMSKGFGNAPYCEDKYIQKAINSMGFQILELKEPIAWHGHHFSFIGLVKRLHNEGVGWRYAGVKYRTTMFIRDMTIGFFKHYRLLRDVFRSGRDRTLAGIGFFQIRPICVFCGNRIIKRVIR